MKRTNKRLALCCTLLAVILAFIWGNSAMPGETSGALSGWLGAFLGKIFPCLATENGLHILRKLAHFSEFAALGMVLSWLYGMTVGKPLWRYSLPLICGAAAACIDETIQIFSPGRYCSIVDVGIDCAGVLTGIMVLYLFITIISLWHKKNGAV